MGQPRDLQLPRPAGWPPWAVAASVAVHLAILAGLTLLYVPARRSGGRHLLVSLAPPAAAAPRAVLAMPPLGADAAAPSGGVLSPPPTPTAPAPSIPGAPPSANRETPADAAGPWPSPAVQRAVPWPTLGSGVLWDRRPTVPTRDARTHAERTDSAVKAIINHYLDSLAALPGGGRVLPPSWKASIGGREYGLDGQWITVAGVKIPSLILALIPFPNGGNESEALDVQGRMRAQDYQLALPRAAAAADRREQIEAIRERNVREEELNQRQRAPSHEATAK